VQLYDIGQQGLWSILASLQDEFAYIYGFAQAEGDLLLLARNKPLTAAELPRWEKLDDAVRADLIRLGLFSTTDLWSLLRLPPASIRALAARASVRNTDDNMFVETLTPWALARQDTAAPDHALVGVELGVWPVLQSMGVDLNSQELGALALSAVAWQGGAEGAPALLETAVRGGSADAQLALALSETAGDDEARRSRLDAVVAAYPTAGMPRLYRARLLNDTEEYEPAAADASAALAAMPGDLRARFERLRAANGIAAEGQADKADAEALADSPYADYRADVLLEAGEAMAAAGELQPAITLLRRYTAREPKEPSGWFVLSEYSKLAGDDDGARAAADNMQRAIFNEAVARHAVALRAERLGSVEEARRWLEGALEVMPDYRPAQADLRRLGGAPREGEF